MKWDSQISSLYPLIYFTQLTGRSVAMKIVWVQKHSNNNNNKNALYECLCVFVYSTVVCKTQIFKKAIFTRAFFFSLTESPLPF